MSPRRRPSGHPLPLSPATTRTAWPTQQKCRPARAQNTRISETKEKRGDGVKERRWVTSYARARAGEGRTYAGLLGGGGGGALERMSWEGRAERRRRHVPARFGPPRRNGGLREPHFRSDFLSFGIGGGEGRGRKRGVFSWWNGEGCRGFGERKKRKSRVAAWDMQIFSANISIRVLFSNLPIFFFYNHDLSNQFDPSIVSLTFSPL